MRSALVIMVCDPSSSLHTVWTSFGIVAEKSSVWRGVRFLSGRACMILSSSFRNPASRRRSASSRTRQRSWASLGVRLPFWSRSINRPGVAIRTSALSTVRTIDCTVRSNVPLVLEILDVGRHVGAAYDALNAPVTATAAEQALCGICNLHRKLTRRREDEDTDPVLGWRVGEVLNRWHEECEGLACTRLGLREHIVALKNRRESGRLHLVGPSAHEIYHGGGLHTSVQNS
jgi:hypothetical protein